MKYTDTFGIVSFDFESSITFYHIRQKVLQVRQPLVQKVQVKHTSPI